MEGVDLGFGVRDLGLGRGVENGFGKAFFVNKLDGFRVWFDCNEFHSLRAKMEKLFD